MGKTGEAISHFNSTVRTIIMAVVVGLLGLGGFQAYQAYDAPRRALADRERELESVISDLNETKATVVQQDKTITGLQDDVAERDVKIDELAENLDRVETAVRLLKLRRRLAKIDVLDQTTDEAGAVTTKVRFTEVADDGKPVGEPAEFDIEGDRIYVEYLVVKFDDQYIEDADLERGTAICLFERIFGEKQEPDEGFVIDEVGSRPNSYARGSVTSEFEQKIWDDFWTIANDREKAAELGIRATHAQAPSIRMEEGATYELDLRATGEFSLQRVE
ncbi:hypothetical protein NG895_28335 [Aeoliella sp. ICT_H6.2]|uniref:Uncharacterized protein n=1 Tax=Aeoliella straminimaris TaxID=2954799 RepID=A0A9X2JJP3_9BACT|nr:hypothetical protein [Aeoliella straminimaris]MCO6047832.1 hypothetical protein [Aeoliella straminimaris]